MSDKEVQAAIAKQKPMEPKIGYEIVLHDIKRLDCRCPACGESIWRNQKYCDECGQKLDWSGVDELASNSR